MSLAIAESLRSAVRVSLGDGEQRPHAGVDSKKLDHDDSHLNSKHSC